MAKLSYIDKSIVENPDFTNPAEDITISVNIGDGESVSFVAQKDFFTPRYIATNRGDVALIQNAVEYTAANVPVVKMPGINQDITDPQYYLNSIVSDRYPIIPIDKYFLELDNDLQPPTPPEDLLQQRQLALNTLLNLQDAATAIMGSDPLAYNDAMANVTENVDAALGNVQPIPPEQQLTPEEVDQLAALDMVGITSVDSPNWAADNVSPTPEISNLDLLSKRDKLAKIVDRSADAKKINQGIELINQGIQSYEDNTQTGLTADGKCKYITIGKGKKGGLFGIGGKTVEKKVSRTDTEKKLALIKEDIAAQEASPTTIIETKSGTPTTVKIQKSSFFSRLIGGIAKAGVLGVIASMVFPPVAAVAGLASLGAIGGAAAAGNIAINTVGAKAFYVPAGCRLMKKEEVLNILNKTKTELEGILAKDC